MPTLKLRSLAFIILLCLLVPGWPSTVRLDAAASSPLSATTDHNETATQPQRAMFTPNAPQIGDVANNAGFFPNHEVPAYAQFKVTFNVATSAENLQLPYDPAPPPGIQPGKGVTVNALFTPDNWQTVYTIPAFYYEDFEVQVLNGREWYYPTGNDSWQVRFAPPNPGQWAFRLEAEDAGGSAVTQAFPFTVIDSANKGFIEVSSHDPRYFSYENGEYFPGLGYNMNFDRLSWDSPVVDNEATLGILAENGVQLIRIWLSQWGIYTPSWGPWNSIDPNLHGQYIPWSGTTFSQAYPGSEVAMKLDAGQNPCMFLGFLKSPPAVKRNTTYRLRIRFKTVNMSGPRINGQAYGLLAKTGGWLWGPGEQCEEPGTGTPITTYQNTPNTDWQILETPFTTGNYDFLPNFYLALENLESGSAYIDRVWLEEDIGGGNYGPNIIDKSWMAQHLYMGQRNSFAFDRLLALAETYGVYLRPVVLEKNDFVFNHINSAGEFTWDGSNDNFYGDGRQITKVRWLQQAWWRYLQARWGYSTSIHSWELLNEGDPANIQHFILADEFGAYMKQFSPNDHLVSTSFWHSFPRDSFWANSAYPNIDFADIHNYIPMNDPAFSDVAEATNIASTAFGALETGGAGKPVIRGETGFVVQGSEPPADALLADTTGVWLHNFIWGGVNPGGLIESYWYEVPHILRQNPGGEIEYDHRWHYGVYYNYIRSIPLANGHYRSLDATVSDSRMRVLGQMDPIGKRAHLWIQNTGHTWQDVVGGVPIQAVSGSVSVEGFNPGGRYAVHWWDTYQPDPSEQVFSTEIVIAGPDGRIQLTVNNLETDTAVQILGGEQLYLPYMGKE